MVNTDDYQGKQGFSIWVKGIVDKLLGIQYSRRYETHVLGQDWLLSIDIGGLVGEYLKPCTKTPPNDTVCRPRD